MQRHGWWVSFFHGAALELWRLAYTRDENRGQAADIVQALGLLDGERVLDVLCGHGRLALEIAARGVRVSGIDLVEESVADGRRSAEERGLELDLHVGDMRALPWAEEFDAAFCAGNSFGYFDREGDLAFLRAVSTALAPGGRFLLEYPLVSELVRARPEYRDWRKLGNRLLLTEGVYDERHGRLEASYTFVDLEHAGGALETRVASYAVRPASEVEALLRAAGFTEVELLGALDGSPFKEGAREFHARAVRA